jgi:hypothetical protein
MVTPEKSSLPAGFPPKSPPEIRMNLPKSQESGIHAVCRFGKKLADADVPANIWEKTKG